MSANNKWLDRVKKLLELAESDNAHEAQLAMQRAHEIIREHNISEAELTKDDEKPIEIDHEVVELYEYGYPWSRNLFNAVAQAYHCKTIFIRVRSKINNTKENYAGHLFGTDGDRATVKMMYTYAADMKKKLGKMELKRFNAEDAENSYPYTPKSTHMRSYNYGVVDGMCETLRGIRDQNRTDKESTGAYGIVLVSTEKKVKEAFKVEYPKTKKLSGDRSGQSSARSSGRAQGSKVSFNRQATGRNAGYLGN